MKCLVIREHSNWKIRNIINIVAIILTFIICIADTIETIIVTIGGINGFNISNNLMYIHVLFSYIKGLIWVVFLWDIIISINTISIKMHKSLNGKQ